MLSHKLFYYVAYSNAIIAIIAFILLNKCYILWYIALLYIIIRNIYSTIILLQHQIYFPSTVPAWQPCWRVAYRINVEIKPTSFLILWIYESNLFSLLHVTNLQNLVVASSNSSPSMSSGNDLLKLFQKTFEGFDWQSSWGSALAPGLEELRLVGLSTEQCSQAQTQGVSKSIPVAAGRVRLAWWKRATILAILTL